MTATGYIRFAGYLVILLVALAGCERKTVAPPPSVVPDKPSVAKPLSGARYIPVALVDLPGFTTDDFNDARRAFSKSCDKFQTMAPSKTLGPGGIGGLVADWQSVCHQLIDSAPRNPDAFRAFLTTNLSAYRVETQTGSEGTFTGYYEASLNGARTRTDVFDTPLYGIPNDLVEVDLGAFSSDLAGRTLVGQKHGHKLRRYPTRSDIELRGHLSDGKAPVVAWVDDPVDAHILHIQGSGRVALPEGGEIRVGYAASNGLKFTGIGGVLLREGVLPPGKGSMPHVRAWLKDNPDRARELMARNARFIFFRELNGEGPIGGFGVPLTPKRSMAVDPAFVPLGIPVWLQTTDPDRQPLHRFMMAQDVGAAITGAVRGDYFWGYGEGAFQKAGRMKSPGKLYILLPRSNMIEGSIVKETPS